MDLLPIGLFLSTIVSLGFTIILIKRAENKTLLTLEVIRTDLFTKLDPILVANSRAMGAISGLADGTKMDKALERRIGQDLMGQNEDVIEMIKMAFPRVAEYIEERPEALTKILPRLNTLISDPETRKRLNLDLSGKTSDLSRIWGDDRR